MKTTERAAIRRCMKQIEDVLVADEERNRASTATRTMRTAHLEAARLARAEKKKAAVDPVAKRKAELWAELEKLEAATKDDDNG